MSLIEVKKVFKSYQLKKNEKNDFQFPVLNGIDLRIKSGSIYALIGASSCGKTTLLSCLLGMQKIDSGEMKICNQKVEFNKSSVFAKMIGYMPQETSLITQLTIYETLQFFSNLFEMNNETFKSRFDMITNLLELPSKHLLIKTLSGGEQRRVSLAVSIIHDPKILILDEPTVGIDFELRDKIWKFLHQQSSEKNLTVLITTHYSCEAAKAHRCGFMRNGVLIADEKPKEILEKLNVETFDEAFYQLSLEECDYKSQIYATTADDEKENSILIKTEEKLKFIRYQVIKGLLIKEYRRIRRQPLELFTVFLLPILLIVLYNQTIGFIPGNLKLGIINEETQTCEAAKLVENCTNQNFSCLFLNHIDGLEKIFYKTSQDGHEDFESGKLFGLISIPANFSKSLLNTRPKNKRFTEAIAEQLKANRGNNKIHPNNTKTFMKHIFKNASTTNVQVILNYSKYPFHLYTQHQILTSFYSFIDKLSMQCNVRELLTLRPFRLDGVMTFDLKASKLPFLAILNPAYAVYYYALFTILQCRSDGDWNRSVLSGMRVSEIFITSLIQGNIIAAVLAFEMIILIAIVAKVQIVASFWIIFGIIFRTTYVGFLVGLMASVVVDTVRVVHEIGQMVYLFSLISSGLLWPPEGMSIIVVLMSYVLPIATSSLAMVNALLKQSEIFDILKHSHILIYEAIFTLACFWLLKRKIFFNVH